MQKLNFPEYRFDLKNQEGKILIFDQLRKKYVVLTPEEWVRQHLISFLIQEKGFSRSLIRVESGLTYFKQKKRADLIIYDNTGKPLLLAECKSPQSGLNPETVFQIGIYQKTIEATYLLVTNGLTHLTWKKEEDGSFRELPEIPSASDLT